MDDLLKHLEVQIKSLVDQHDQLRQSNLLLQNSKGSLAREKELLLARQQKAVSQIESLVSKLKAIEKLS
ncbi:MAG TPA: TIGR02449 family protein [Gammaproteobacteria bacterium]|jgi:uncharacterized protein (TIGR02449 family)|nr:TIGR02449 family protein [Gammaproteobacteria bacterium]